MYSFVARVRELVILTTFFLFFKLLVLEPCVDNYLSMLKLRNQWWAFTQMFMPIKKVVHGSLCICGVE